MIEAMEAIASEQNRLVKLAVRLKRRKCRAETGLFAVEGVRLAEEAVQSDWRIEFALCSQALPHHPRVLALLESLRQKGCPLYRVSKAIYDKVSDTQEPQGILLAVAKRVCSLPAMIGAGGQPLILILDGLQDPGNVGTILRTADAAGCGGVILLKGCADLFSGKAVRAAMGSVFHLPVAIEADAPEVLEFLRAQGIPLQAAALDAAARPYFQLDYTQAAAVVFGNEGSGVSEAVLRGVDGRIFIPMAGKSESLNVATAAAVIAYESLRQRMLTKSCDL